MQLLIALHVLRKSTPSPERLAQLQEHSLRKFSAQRRYLVWNPPEEWRVDEPKFIAPAALHLWNSYRGNKSD
jgi:hypothetical protein